MGGKKQLMGFIKETINIFTKRRFSVVIKGMLEGKVKRRKVDKDNFKFWMNSNLIECIKQETKGIKITCN